MGEYMFNIGDYVTRNSYNNDIVFKIIGIENDIYYKPDMWSYLLSDMMESTIVFWNKQGYDVSLSKKNIVE